MAWSPFVIGCAQQSFGKNANLFSERNQMPQQSVIFSVKRILLIEIEKEGLF